MEQVAENSQETMPKRTKDKEMNSKSTKEKEKVKSESELDSFEQECSIGSEEAESKEEDGASITISIKRHGAKEYNKGRERHYGEFTESDSSDDYDSESSSGGDKKRRRRGGRKKHYDAEGDEDYMRGVLNDMKEEWQVKEDARYCLKEEKT